MPNPYFTWSMAEELAVGHMRAIGYTDAKRTKSGADGGIDVTSARAAAQVKYHAAPIGIAEMQRMRGIVHDGRQAFFYSSSGYSTSAAEYAAAAGIALFTFTDANQVRAVNEVARKLSGLAARAPQPPAPPTEDLEKAADEARKAALREFLVLVWQHIHMEAPLEARLNEIRDSRRMAEAAERTPGAATRFKYFAERAYPRLRDLTSTIMKDAKSAKHADGIRQAQERLLAERERFYSQGAAVGVNAKLYVPPKEQLQWEDSTWKLKDQ